MKNFSKISIIVVLVLIFSAGAVFLSLQPEDYGPCQWMNGVSGCRPKDEKVGTAGFASGAPFARNFKQKVVPKLEVSKIMEIVSPAFENNSHIPGKYTCDGENIHPPLQIGHVPRSEFST